MHFVSVQVRFVFVTILEDTFICCKCCVSHRRIPEGAQVISHPQLLEKSEIFMLSEILRRRAEIFITHLYKNALFHIYMSLSGLCTLFSKVTLFSLPEVFCEPQICQKCVGGRGSASDPAGGLTTLPQTPSRLGRGCPHPLRIMLYENISSEIE